MTMRPPQAASPQTEHKSSKGDGLSPKQVADLGHDYWQPGRQLHDLRERVAELEEVLERSDTIVWLLGESLRSKCTILADQERRIRALEEKDSALRAKGNQEVESAP